VLRQDEFSNHSPIAALLFFSRIERASPQLSTPAVGAPRNFFFGAVGGSTDCQGCAEQGAAG
jgi:hypothetical protein